MIEISSSFESSKHVPVSFWFAAVLHKGHPKAQQIALSFLLPVGPISAGQLEPRPRQFHHWQHQWLVWNLLRLRSSCLRSELQCASQIFLISCVFLFSAQPLKHSDAFGQPSKWIWIMQQTSLHDFILKEMKHTLHQQDFHPFSQSLPGNPLASLYHIAVQKDVGFREYGSPGSNHNGRMCSFMCLSSICTCPIPRLPRACTSCLQVRREPSCPTCIRWHDLAPPRREHNADESGSTARCELWVWKELCGIAGDQELGRSCHNWQLTCGWPPKNQQRSATVQIILKALKPLKSHNGLNSNQSLLQHS